MEPIEVILNLWQQIEARDWDAAAALLSDDLVVEWPATEETFLGPENFVAIQREYPEGWSIHVLRLVADGMTVVSEVEVPQEGMGVFRAVSFWQVENGRVTSAREYWTSLGMEEAPAWRKPYRRGPPEG